jgi:glycosyltransferase involved in cell wall biosynthesis
MPKLSICFACHDDVEGAFFTLTSLRLHQIGKKYFNDVEIVVADDFPAKTKDLENVCNLSGAKYHHIAIDKGPARAKQRAIELTTGDYFLLVDSHVLLAPGSVDYIMQLIDNNMIGKDMIVGPLMNESCHIIATELKEVWRGDFFGIWHVSESVTKGQITEIAGSGSAYFLMKKEHWPGFNKNYEGFGGEELISHEMVRKNGGKVFCHPRLGWIHRFLRSKPFVYKCDLIDKIYNYLVGFYSVGWSCQDVVDFFRKTPHAMWVDAAVNRAIAVHPDLFEATKDGRKFEHIVS